MRRRLAHGRGLEGGGKVIRDNLSILLGEGVGAVKVQYLHEDPGFCEKTLPSLFATTSSGRMK